MGERLLIFIILVTISWFFCIIKTFRLWLATNMHKLIYMYQMYHDLLSIGLRPASIVRHDMSRILPLKHPWMVSFFFRTPTFKLEKLPAQQPKSKSKRLSEATSVVLHGDYDDDDDDQPFSNIKPGSLVEARASNLSSRTSGFAWNFFFIKSRRNLSQFLANRWIIRGW